MDGLVEGKANMKKKRYTSDDEVKKIRNLTLSKDGGMRKWWQGVLAGNFLCSFCCFNLLKLSILIMPKLFSIMPQLQCIKSLYLTHEYKHFIHLSFDTIKKSTH